MNAEEYVKKYKAIKKLLDDEESGRVKMSPEKKEKLQNDKVIMRENIRSPGEPYSSIIEKHYIHGLNLKVIAQQIHYSYAHTKRLHKEALKKIEDIIKDEPL